MPPPVGSLAQTGIITTVAGTERGGFSGDGGPATSAQLNFPVAIALEASGNLFIADRDNHRIRKVTVGTGLITTVAGTGTQGFSGDQGSSTNAQLNRPEGIAVDADGNLYIADTGNHRIRRVAAGTGRITTEAGTGTAGVAGDGGSGTAAQLSFPSGLAIDAGGNLYIAERLNDRIRKVRAGTGTMTTVAGPGVFDFSMEDGGPVGDGGPATAARLALPSGVAVDASGNLFIADRDNFRIRKVGARTGLITTAAGKGAVRFVNGFGIGGFGGDGGPATSALLSQPSGVGLDSSGNLFIADTANNRIRKVEAGTGIITTVAGMGATNILVNTNAPGLGLDGDGGPATSAAINHPVAVAFDGNGNLFIAAPASLRIRRVARTVTSVRPTITMPADGTRLSSGRPTAFAWTPVAGAAQYGFEHTGPGRRFANPNGTGPDSDNGFGGAGGGFVLSVTSFTLVLPPSIPPGSYQVRVIGLSPTNQVVGAFSDAVTVVVSRRDGASRRLLGPPLRARRP